MTASPAPAVSDWLVDGSPFRVRTAHTEDTVSLDNGLVRRTWRLGVAGCTVAYDNLMTGEALLRAPSPETRVTLDGREYLVGGLVGAAVTNFTGPHDLAAMSTPPGAFTLREADVGDTRARFAWLPRREWIAGQPGPWPPPGRRVTFRYEPPSDGPDVEIEVAVQLYDGVPVLDKTVTIRNRGPRVVRLGSVELERLAMVDTPPLLYAGAMSAWSHLAPLHVECEMAYGGSMDPVMDNPLVRWSSDPAHARTGANVGEIARVSLLTVSPSLGPDVDLGPGDELTLPTVFEALYDSGEAERRGATRKAMYRLLSPWVMENPLIMHVTSTDPVDVRAAIDQAAAAGFDLVILSFGSGLRMEDDSAENIAAMKALADYAHDQGVGLGGYSLLASRRISDADDVIDPATGRPDAHARFLASPCLGSTWGIDYLRRIRHFLAATGFDNLEHDGSYPGDLCASTSHPGHQAVGDSVWQQWHQVADLYRWARGRGIYLTIPDWYFFVGSNRTGMGYVETNWSLPRAQQEIIERQNIYDGTWNKLPSMGWMHVPLEEYHGGGAAATIEPLHEHLEHYGRRLMQLFGSGVTGVFRGRALFDTAETQTVVRRSVDFYRRYAGVLSGDIIHVRRPDARDLDAICHVLPGAETPALLVVTNPLAEPVERVLAVPVDRAGLAGVVEYAERDGTPRLAEVDRRGRVLVTVGLAPRSTTWLTLRARE